MMWRFRRLKGEVMKEVVDVALDELLAPAELKQSQVEAILGGIVGGQVDNADLYFQACQIESWVLEDGLVKDASYSVDRGVGVRAISHHKVGFAYSDDILLPSLMASAEAARSIAKHGGKNNITMPSPRVVSPLYSAANPLAAVSAAEKIELLHQVDRLARGVDARVSRVIASLTSAYETVLIMASDGTLAADIRPMVRLNVTVMADQRGRREQGVSGAGGRFSLGELINEGMVEQVANEAVRQALINLDAVSAPAGLMPVVLGPGWPGVLLHEAVGHGLEGDFNRKGTSVFSGRIGEQVASPLCTIVDDGTLPNRRGSLTIDDEGVASQCTTLIEKGVLVNYMQDKLNARLMGMKPTGNGRRESYAHQPLPRMTNTYMLAGEHKPEEIIASVDKGIYAVNFGGGEVDITSGKFVFSASEAYLIERGKVTRPIKGVTLIGSGAEVLQQVSMVGDDLALDEGVGTCGKDGQQVPVGVGQPTLKLDALTVGGTLS